MGTRPCLGCGGEIVLTSTCRDLFLCSECYRDLLVYLARKIDPTADVSDVTPVWKTLRRLQGPQEECENCFTPLHHRFRMIGKAERKWVGGKREEFLDFEVVEWPKVYHHPYYFCDNECVFQWMTRGKEPL